MDWKVNSLQFKIIGPLAGFDADVPMANQQEESKEGEAALKMDNDAPKMTQERMIDDIKAPIASF